MHTEGESDSGIKLKSNWRKFDSALISRMNADAFHNPLEELL